MPALIRGPGLDWSCGAKLVRPLTSNLSPLCSRCQKADAGGANANLPRPDHQRMQRRAELRRQITANLCFTSTEEELKNRTETPLLRCKQQCFKEDIMDGLLFGLGVWLAFSIIGISLLDHHSLCVICPDPLIQI